MTQSTRCILGWVSSPLIPGGTENNMPKATPVTVNGLSYRSQRAAARAHGIRWPTVQNRLRDGWDIERAITEPLVAFPNAKAVAVNGREFPSLAHAARAYGAEKDRVQRWVREGLSIDEALEKGAAPQRTPVEITVFGRTFPNLKAAAEAYGQCPARLSVRLKLGWDPQRAITEGVCKNGSAMPVTAFGMPYPSLSAAAKAHRKSTSRVANAMRRGWTLEHALSSERRASAEVSEELRSTPVVIGGIGATMRDHAERLGIPVRTVVRRWREGKMPLERALTTPLRTTGTFDVYVISRTSNGASYVGVSDNYEARWIQHIQRGELLIGWAIKRFGPAAFEFKVVASADTPQEASTIESRLISELRTRWPRGYNGRRSSNYRPPTRNVKVGDKVYPSIAAACRSLRTSRSTVRRRMRNGWSLEQALQPGRIANASQGVTIDGTRYKSYGEAAKVHGLKYPKIATLMRRYKLTFEEALKFDPAKDGRFSLKVGETWYPSLRAAADAAGISPQLARWRSRAWELTIEQVLLLDASNAERQAGRVDRRSAGGYSRRAAERQPVRERGSARRARSRPSGRRGGSGR